MKLAVLAGVVLVGVAAGTLGGCGSDAGDASLESDMSADAGLADAASAAAATTGAATADAAARDALAPDSSTSAFPLGAYEGCSGSEYVPGADDQLYSPADLMSLVSVAETSPGHLVVSLLDPFNDTTSSLSFTTVSPTTAVADAGQTTTTSSVIDAGSSPLPLPVTAGVLSLVGGWVYVDLASVAATSKLGVADIDLADTVTYSISCPAPGAAAAAAPAPVAADSTLARRFMSCTETVGEAQAGIDVSVQLGVSGSAITATVSSETSAGTALAFTADTRSSGVLSAGQQLSVDERICLGAPADDLLSLTSGNLVVDGDVLFVDLATTPVCNENPTVEIVCYPEGTN